MILVLTLLGIIALLIGVATVNSPQFIGELGESKLRNSAERNLPADTYKQFHDVILPSVYGTTQIDHILVSPFGIFVIETKNMKGWIFGNATQIQWTQVLFNESFKFQNPLRQNYGHIKALESILGVRPSVFHSMVVFVGDSTFKTPMPENVRTGRDYLSYIQSFYDPILSDSAVLKLASQIQKARLEPSRETARIHVFSLKTRAAFSSDVRCPKCGHGMELRIAKKGFRAGSRFLGCSRYPTCRGIVNIT